jgi:hypothetical protein
MPSAAYDQLPINPQLLRDHSWLLHRNKIPYYANGRKRSGKLDSDTDLGKLVAYDEALTAMAAGTYTGLGIAINRGIQFIDLDKCRNPDTGVLQPWALTVFNVAKALDAYIEISISGTGVHIVGFGGPLPTHKGKQVEVYTHKRYMALGRPVMHTGSDPLPDLKGLLGVMQERMLPSTPRQANLRLVKSSPMLFVVEEAATRKMLAKFDPDMGYEDWRNVGMALHDGSAGSQQGLDIWEAWSAKGEKWVEEGCAKLWAGFKAGGGITMGTLHHMAQQADTPPKPKATPVEEPVARRKEFTFDELMDTEHAPIPWLVDGMICPGLTLLAAPPKMGKSYFVLQLGMCVASGTPFLGRQTTKAKVSYFDLEEWEELLKVRAVDIKRGNNITKPLLRFAMETSGGDVTVLEDLQRHIDEGSKLLIIDLLARVRDELGEDSTKNAYARDYAVLRQFADFVLNRNPGISIIIVHHTNKGTNHEGWQDKISGSQGLAGASHCNMLLANLDMRNLDDDARREALKHRRFHLVGKAVAGDEMILKMMENRGGWEVTERTADDVKMMSKHRHVLQILREADGAWVTAKEVHEQSEGTLDAVKKMLLRMAKKGEIQSSGSGGAGYRLPPSA